MSPSEHFESVSPSGRDAIAAFLQTPNLLRFLDYWRSKRQERGVPSRTDIDPIEIHWALPWTFLMDFEQPDVFRYRLAGRELEDVFGRSLKGCTLKDVLPPETLPEVIQRWMPLVEKRAVICMKGLVYQAKDRLPLGERIMLPLADRQGGRITGLLGMTVYKMLPASHPMDIKPADVLTVPVDRIS